MTSSFSNVKLMTYLILVAIIGTLGNGIILLAYGNRWNSSKSTSVVFILILACFDLWTCLIAVPTIAIMEYRDLDVPTFICRFYAFSKNLIIISSFIMSFVAIDRFFNIALPHYRLLNPRRVKILLTVFITIGIGLSIVTALAFSTQPKRKIFDAHYSFNITNQSDLTNEIIEQISLPADYNGTLDNETEQMVMGQLSTVDGASPILNKLEYKLTTRQCFADTSIISDTLRDILKHISNKFFFVSIGVVTIFYSITFVLALQRQKPRIKALKKSLYVLTKFDTPLNPVDLKRLDSSMSSTTGAVLMNTIVGSHQNSATTKTLSVTNCSNSTRHSPSTNEHFDDSNVRTHQNFELINIIINNEDEDRRIEKNNNEIVSNNHEIKDREVEGQISISDETSDDLQTNNDKLNDPKRVSFLVDNGKTTSNSDEKKKLSMLSVSFEGEIDIGEDIYYKVPYPCSKTRELLIKFHFTRSASILNRFICCCCCCYRCCPTRQKNVSSLELRKSSLSCPAEDETTTILTPVQSNNQSSSAHSETLRRQLHQHRLKQIRMASTFLLITVSFVFFYLPSILNAERIITSPMTIYYLYLCTHVLNPLIYCFMHPSLRAYVISMFRCRSGPNTSNKPRKNGRTSFYER